VCVSFLYTVVSNLGTLRSTKTSIKGRVWLHRVPTVNCMEGHTLFIADETLTMNLKHVAISQKYYQQQSLKPK
jgi:hypothetical protein